MNEHGRWLRWTAVLLLLAAVIAIGLIAAGAFDPRPIGTEQWQRPLAAESVPANSRRLLWLNQPLPDRPYSVRLTATYHSGELDIGYGLVLGNETEYLAVAVSPLGYVAIWQAISKQLPHNSQRLPSSFILHPSSFILHPSSFILHPSSFILHPSSFILPWQPWPHVQSGAETNELWIDVDQTGNPKTGHISVRINRELLWQGRLDIPDGHIGLLAESFGAAAVVDFQRIQLFTPQGDFIRENPSHPLNPRTHFRSDQR